MGTVIVIGGAGFVGRHLVRHLSSIGSRVVATCRTGGESPSVAGVEWIACDLAASDFTAKFPKAYDAIVYLAQSSRWREFPAGAADIFHVNLAALHRMAEHARAAGAKRFVHFSTGTVYSQTREPAREDEPIRPDAPRSFYASTKLAAELQLQPYTQFFGITQLRLFMPYGVGQNDRMLLPSIVAKVRGGVPVDLHGPDGLRCNPVAIADVVDVVRRYLDLNGSQTVNVAGPEILSLRQVAETIGTVLGKPPRFQIRSEVPPVIVGDTSRLREALGWRPETRFADGVRNWLSGSGG
jgi:nucleoside-diphosphate-sugar epimerase